MATSVPPQNRKLLHTKKDVACTTRKKKKDPQRGATQGTAQASNAALCSSSAGKGQRRKDRLRQTPPSRTKWRRHRPRPRLGDQSRHPHPAAHLGHRDPLKGKKPIKEVPLSHHAPQHRVKGGQRLATPPPRASAPVKRCDAGDISLHWRDSAAGHDPSDEENDGDGDGGSAGASAAPDTAAATSAASTASATCVAVASATTPSNGRRADAWGGSACHGAGASRRSVGRGGRGRASGGGPP